MADWSELMADHERAKRGEFSRSLLMNVDLVCLTRKPRDPVKRRIMHRLGLPERYPEVQFPSPGNTPEDLYDEEI
jgi:hypothetical protein